MGKFIEVEEQRMLLRSRRRFVQGLAVGGVATAFAIGTGPASAATHPMQSEVLRGTEFDLVISDTPMNFTGTTRRTTSVNGTIPGPTLRMREGDVVTIRVTNRLQTSTSIHWHGLLLPFEMDGVPGISFPGIAPGETFTYRFKVQQNGTYWYYSHTKFQEQTGLYGAIVIDPANADPISSDRDHVLLLSDWTDSEPEFLYRRLKQESDFFNFQMPTAGMFFRDVSQMGLGKALEKRKMWNQMRMNPTDLGDVSGSTFTYLANGAPPAANWTALVKSGEKVRLRIINGSSTTIFDVRIPGLKMTVVSADGQQVEPVEVDEFRISVAETYDVVVHIPDENAYTIFAQSIDRTGYTRATLAPRKGMAAPVPEMDPKTWLAMVDMGMGDMDMGGTPPKTQLPAPDHSAMQGMDMSSTKPMQSGSPPNAAHDMSSMTNKAAMPDSGHSSMPGMDMSSGKNAGEMNMSKESDKRGMDMAPKKNGPGMDMAGDKSMAVMDTGPSVDSRAMSPSSALNDPGPRLRGNGRRVLTYSDLHSVGGPLDKRAPSREIVMRLTGNMKRFVWGFDGKKFSEVGPVHFRYGERVRITLINDSMMNHPIHLHGMFSDIEDEQGKFLVRKHTVNVQPSKKISFLVTADAPGQWAFHCHLLYHMEAGMFRMVVVS